MDNKLEFKFIHWAGVPRPRPSIFCHPLLRWLDPSINKFDDYKRYEGFPEIPGYALWRYFQANNEYPMRVNDRLLSSYSDLKRLAKLLKSKERGFCCALPKGGSRVAEENSLPCLRIRFHSQSFDRIAAARVRCATSTLC